MYFYAVIDPPDVLVQPNYKPYVVLVGDDVTLNCNVTDTNPPVTSFVWTNRSESTENITMNNISYNASGTYECIGVNGIDGAVPSSTYLDVQCEPIFIDKTYC